MRNAFVLTAGDIPMPDEIYPDAPKIDQYVLDQHNAFVARCRALWRELHAEQNATPEWCASWVSRVPNFGCGCQSWLAEYLVGNPPRYDDWQRWGWECHNAINVKLGKTEMPWDEFAGTAQQLSPA